MLLAYRPRPRGCVGWAVDLLVLVAVVVAVALYARRDEIACAYNGATASCTISMTDALEVRTTRRIDGIHSLAYRSGTHVGLVTDAKNKDAMAPFGTREIEAWDETAAKALESFFEERSGPIALWHGPAHPSLYGLLAMLVVFSYAAATRPLSFVVRIDRDRKILVLQRRGPFFSRHAQSWDLSAVRAFDAQTDGKRYRVRMMTSDGRSLLFTERFWPGEHHDDFVARVNDALFEEAA